MRKPSVVQQGSTLRVRGSTPPPSWVLPVSVGIFLFVVVASLISEGLCFACAEKGATWGPLALVPLVLAWGRGFALSVGPGGVDVQSTFLGVPFRRWSASSARIMKLAGPGESHDPRFGASLTLEGSTERTVLLGDHRTVTSWIGEVEGVLCPKSSPS